MDDIKNRIIRFVGVADKRVKEDYLRIMRYFRFYGRVCQNCDYHDPESINAIINNVQGLKRNIFIYKIFLPINILPCF